MNNRGDVLPWSSVPKATIARQAFAYFVQQLDRLKATHLKLRLRIQGECQALCWQIICEMLIGVLETFNGSFA